MQKESILGAWPTKAYALEVSILKVLNEKERNASSYTTRIEFDRQRAADRGKLTWSFEIATIVRRCARRASSPSCARPD